ncbi:MAG: nucleotidyltransferase family protein [Acidobacteria bacterium]|nr:nucleotidyltransferase family protein [Acidobacteriota bacterium]
MINGASIGAIVLAAGVSQRMGSPKQLLSFKGNSLLRHAVQTALGSRCRPVVVVLGAHADKLESEISDLPVTSIENRLWAEGMGSSIRTGIAGLEGVCEQAAGALVTLCDQPYVSSQTLDQLISVFEESRPLAVASEYAGSLGAPALFGRELFAELAALRSTEGAKQILKRHQHDVLHLSVPEARWDVDTPADYERLMQMNEMKN